MGKKKRKQPNPVYVKGVNKGIEIGKDITFDVVAEVLADLCDQKGIGEVTQNKIMDAIDEIPRKVNLKESDIDER